jgi:hypothetical protein
MIASRSSRIGLFALFTLALLSLPACEADDAWTEGMAPDTELEFAVSFSDELSA